jgi:hypothetical protein
LPARLEECGTGPRGLSPNPKETAHMRLLASSTALAVLLALAAFSADLATYWP